MKNKVGIVLLIIGGVLMIISSVMGSIGIYEFLRDYISNQIPSDLNCVKNILNVLVEILRWIANTGGGAVIVGAILIMLEQYRFGKWLIGIGLTFGSLALIIWLISMITNSTGISIPYIDRLKVFFTYNTGLQFTGVVVAIIGRNLIKKPKKVEKSKEEQAKDAEISEPTVEIPSENKYCPNCGFILSLNALYCNECGNSLENR